MVEAEFKRIEAELKSERKRAEGLENDLDAEREKSRLYKEQASDLAAHGEKLGQELDLAVRLWQVEHCQKCPAQGICEREPVIDCFPGGIRIMYLEKVKRIIEAEAENAAKAGDAAEAGE